MSSWPARSAATWGWRSTALSPPSRPRGSARAGRGPSGCSACAAPPRTPRRATVGCWLDPGPYGCLGTGLGYAIAARLARPSSQVVLLLGDGAAGLSLMDVDTLVRHKLPVVMVCGNNAGWALEKWPMRAVYGYDVAADLAP